MDSRRVRFHAAIGLFIVWVIALGVIAAVSARKPATRATAPAGPAL